MLGPRVGTGWMPKGPNPAKPDAWVSEMFPDVEVPFNPFPGIVTVLPNMEIVERVKAREIAVKAAGGTAQVAGSLTMGLTGDMPSAFPSSICGEGGSDPENCLRTIAPDVYYGNEDSQRITVGNTLVIECFVDGCGIGIGDVHGAQGDGEVSITAIEIEALVKTKVKIIKPDDPMYHLPSPTTLGKTMNPLSTSPFVSFHGFGNKPEPIPEFAEEAEFPWPIQQHLTFKDAAGQVVTQNMTFVADNLQERRLPSMRPPHPDPFPRSNPTHVRSPSRVRGADGRAQRADQVHQMAARRARLLVPRGPDPRVGRRRPPRRPGRRQAAGVDGGVPAARHLHGRGQGQGVCRRRHVSAAAWRRRRAPWTRACARGAFEASGATVLCDRWYS